MYIIYLYLLVFLFEDTDNIYIQRKTVQRLKMIIFFENLLHDCVVHFYRETIFNDSMKRKYLNIYRGENHQLDTRVYTCNENKTH